MLLGTFELNMLMSQCGKLDKLMNMSVFAGFRVPQHCAAVSQQPAALRRPQEKHAPARLEQHLVEFVDFCLCL